jgi:hypothetical protein
VLVSVLFSQLLLVKVYEEEGHTAQQDAGGAATEYILFSLVYSILLVSFLTGGA